MLKVGITGGIGSGKSIICHIFQLLGISVINADEVAKKLYYTDIELKKSIIKLLGDNIYINDELNKSLFKKLLFDNKELRQTINDIVHPKVQQYINEWMLGQKGTYCIKEAALMIESGSYKHLDYLICVISDEALRMSRLLKRDHSNEEDIKKIIESQIDDETRMQYADFVINNNEHTSLITQVMNIHGHLINIAL